MLIGAMNHPAQDVLSEIEWMSEMGLEFVDLTLEPPAAGSQQVNARCIRDAIERNNMQVVGHTAYWLPLASPFEEVRRAAVGEAIRCIQVFGEVGVKWMNLHPDRHAPLHSRAFYVGRNIISIGEMLPHAAKAGLGLMIENLPGDFNTPEQLGELLDPVPELGLHLDIGHANLLVPFNTTESILNSYGSRLRHVHLHDNKGGGADLHMALGTGTVDYRRAIRALKACDYDQTITLEVFAPDRQYLRYSRDLLRQAWSEA